MSKMDNLTYYYVASQGRFAIESTAKTFVSHGSRVLEPGRKHYTHYNIRSEDRLAILLTNQEAVYTFLISLL